MKINEFFQKGYYINLDFRVERKESFLNEMKKYNLENFFEKYAGFYHKDYGYKVTHQACSRSHITLIKKAYDLGYERVLIFEDDTYFYENGIENVEKSLCQLNKIQDWDAIYLGAMIIDPYLNFVDENLLRQKVLLTNHAIGYSRSGMKKMLEFNWEVGGASLDGWMSNHEDLKKYVTYPIGLAQVHGLSDLNGFGYGAPLYDYLRGYEQLKAENILTNNYISCRLQGRTGNIMFQIAHAYVKSLKYNRQFIAPSSESLTTHLENNLLRKIDFSFPRTDSLIDVNLIIEPNFEYHNLPPKENSPTVYQGWFQSEKHFENYSNIIRNLFSPTKEFLNKCFIDFPFLKRNNVVAAINVRRGDYLLQPRRHPVVTINYINEAYKQLPKHDILLVVSDDIKWCKENIKLPNVIFNEIYNDQDALWLLSLCNHFIISNSTFSWWGAWLSKYKNKTVIAPSTWFGPDISSDPKDVYCDGWIKIPTYWKNGFIELK